jgi:acetyl esterase/lipase
MHLSFLAKKLWLAFLAVPFFNSLGAQEVVPLYNEAIPYAKPVVNRERSVPGADGKPRISKVSEPTLAVFLPPQATATGTAVIICPGGGYRHLSIEGEGYEVARLLNEWGVAAFVLKYRLPDDSTMERKEIGPLQDAQRAVQLVRQNARQWRIQPGRVGIMGFSAGGHLAATLGTHYRKAEIPNRGQVNLRPDFMVLAYPVISVPDSLSRVDRMLLGEGVSAQKAAQYSREFAVDRNTPPTFLVHARDDKAVDVTYSTSFYDKLRKKGVPAEIYLYETGGHGFGLTNKTSPEKWTDRLKVWMRDSLKVLPAGR